MNDVIELSNVAYFVIVSLAVLFVTFTIIVSYVTADYIRTLQRRILDLSAELSAAAAKAKSVQLSHSVFRGLLAENIFPVLSECQYNAHDMQFIGKPFDFLVLNGYTQGSVDEIVFLEIKTGSSRLSKMQRSVRDTIAAGRVRWETAHVVIKGEHDEPASSDQPNPS